ncbi:MAG: DUF1573 domain-containing protein [Planctomycetes bacterium]|nr:DUF1573 domain-containing protein [Planctomycetota bacterium]
MFRISPQSFLLSAALLAATGAAVLGYLAIPGPPEEFAAVNPDLNFGNVGQAQSVIGEFELVNRLKQEVEILGTMESCSCTTIGMGAKRLAPGEKTTVKADWRTGTARGEKRVQIYVKYRLADTDESYLLSLAMSGNVTPDVDVQPIELAFRPGVKETKTVQIGPGVLKNVNVKEVFTSHSAFFAAVSAKHLIHVKFDPTKWQKGDDHVPYLGIRTNSKVEPLVRVDLVVKE